MPDETSGIKSKDSPGSGEAVHTSSIKELLQPTSEGKKGRKSDPEYDDPVDFQLINLVELLGPYFYRMGLSPNVFTTLSLIFAIASCYFLVSRAFLIAGVCWFINYFFDCVDGNFARRYNMTSEFGDWYDHISDWITYLLMCYCVLITCKDMLVGVTIITLLTLSTAIACLHSKNEYAAQIEDGGNSSESLSLLGFLPSVDMSITKFYGLGMNGLVTSIVLSLLPQLEHLIAHLLFVSR